MNWLAKTTSACWNLRMIWKHIPLIGLAAILCQCSGGGNFGRMSLNKAPKVVNVSSWDPKERQRGGSGFSENNVSALAANGACGLIARTGKGGVPDEKCAAFLSSAHRESMKLGTYYFVTKGTDPVMQADQYVSLVRGIAHSRGLCGTPVLLAGDFDTKSTPAEMIRFLDRVESLTGVPPIIYLENSDRMRAMLSAATPAQKARLRHHPYWIALYSHDKGFRTPAELMAAHGTWKNWAMWQYAGVEWKHGRSQPQVYHYGSWRAPRYFGTMDRPLEHNAFNGDQGDLEDFWAKHSWTVP